MNFFEIAALLNSVAGASILASLMPLLLSRIDLPRRKRFWLIFTGSLVLNAMRLMIRSINWLSADENLFLDSIFQLAIELYVFRYLYKTYFLPSQNRQEDEVTKPESP